MRGECSKRLGILVVVAIYKTWGDDARALLLTFGLLFLLFLLLLMFVALYCI